MEQSDGPRSPGGISISSRLIVPAGAAFEPERRALAAIDAVHGDGDLPRCRVRLPSCSRHYGQYDSHGWVPCIVLNGTTMTSGLSDNS